MDEESKIKLVSTSKFTADATPIILNQTDRIQLKFDVTIIDNSKNKENSLSGSLIYSKKQKNVNEFPIETISKKDVKIGEILKITLNSEETRKLYNGLSDYYKLSERIPEIPSGTAKFVKVDNRIDELISDINKLSDQKSLDILCNIMKRISTIDFRLIEQMFSGFSREDFNEFSRLVSLEKINRLISQIEMNLNNNSEEFWQNLFTEDNWVLSQSFGLPIVYAKDKAYVGGKSLNNNGGLICDYLYRNKLTSNAVLIEIKTPQTKIIKGSYRSTYSFSDELSGSINQLNMYRDTLIKTFGLSENECKFFSPNCLLVIGKVSDLNITQKETFDLYRNSLGYVQIITFDEILEKIKSLKNILVD